MGLTRWTKPTDQRYEVDFTAQSSALLVPLPRTLQPNLRTTSTSRNCSDGTRCTSQQWQEVELLRSNREGGGQSSSHLFAFCVIPLNGTKLLVRTNYANGVNFDSTDVTVGWMILASCVCLYRIREGTSGDSNPKWTQQIDQIAHKIRETRYLFSAQRM